MARAASTAEPRLGKDDIEDDDDDDGADDGADDGVHEEEDIVGSGRRVSFVLAGAGAGP